MTNFFTHKFRKKSPVEIAAMIIFGTLFFAGLAILFCFIVMWLWNWLMPELFGITTITFWQAAGIFILAKILLGGCNFGSDKSCKDEGKSKKKPKTDFSKWKHYDQFWKEEGDAYYKAYVARKIQSQEEDNPEPDMDNA